MRLPENSHAKESDIAYDQAVNQYNHLLQSAKDLYPDRADIQGLRRYRRTYNVPVDAFEDAVSRLQTALANESIAAPEPLFSELSLPSAKSIVFETTHGAYRVDRVVGEGGAGRVYKVHDANNEVFAIKLLDPHRVTDERSKRFKNEFHFGRQNSTQTSSRPSRMVS
jgi:serine/threonine protein kinase